MSPESRCNECGRDFVARTHDELIGLEQEHHVASYGVVDPAAGVGIHDCASFTIFDDSGREIGCDTFAHGRYEPDYSFLLPSGRSGD